MAEEQQGQIQFQNNSDDAIQILDDDVANPFLPGNWCQGEANYAAIQSTCSDLLPNAANKKSFPIVKKHVRRDQWTGTVVPWLRDQDNVWFYNKKGEEVLVFDNYADPEFPLDNPDTTDAYDELFGTIVNAQTLQRHADKNYFYRNNQDNNNVHPVTEATLLGHITNGRVFKTDINIYAKGCRRFNHDGSGSILVSDGFMNHSINNNNKESFEHVIHAVCPTTLNPGDTSEHTKQLMMAYKRRVRPTRRRRKIAVSDHPFRHDLVEANLRRDDENQAGVVHMNKDSHVSRKRYENNRRTKRGYKAIETVTTQDYKLTGTLRE